MTHCYGGLVSPGPAVEIYDLLGSTVGGSAI